MPVAPSCQSGCQAHESVSRIGRGLEPALGREQVDAAVAVDVARADAVPGRRGAEVVLLELDAPGRRSFLTTSYQTTTLTVLGKTSGTPSPDRSTIQAASILPGTSTS